MTPNPPSPPPPLPSGFQRALNSFEARLTPSEKAQFQVVTLDELKTTILTIQAEQRARKKMVGMSRVNSFLEAMEQFGKVIDVFVNSSSILAYVWGPLKLLLLTATTWSESFDALLDAYQRISESLPIFEGYQNTFANSSRMQDLLEHIWSNILEFHIRALRIFEQSMLRLLFRSLWKDFGSRFQQIITDLKRQKETIESHAEQIHINNYESDRLKVLEEFNQVRAQRSAERTAFIAHWLASESPQSPQADHELQHTVRQQQHESTGIWPGLWILEHEDVKEWLAPRVPKSSTLWISGIPGAGKSVLASAIIDETKTRNTVLQRPNPAQSTVPIAFFYCKHGDPDRSTFISIMRSLLAQLAAQQTHLTPFYYDEAIGSGEVVLRSIKLCKRLLRNTLQNIPAAFLVIDGLDECSPGERKSFMDFANEVINLCDNTKPGKVRLLILSTNEPDIQRAMSMATLLRINPRDTQKDIAAYVKHRAGIILDKFPHELSAQDREYIEHNVLDRSDGMFLYAKLVMAHLEGQPSFHDLREEFHCLPRGLEEAYARNLDRVWKNPRENERKMAMRVLSLMMCCRRPLRWREIQSAISIDYEQRVVDKSRRLGFHIRDICGSLIEVLPGDRVEFVHTTASLHIAELKYVHFSMAEQSMAMLCLHYLTFECFEQPVDNQALSAYTRDGFYGFQDYAVTHWADHLLSFFEALSGDNSQAWAVSESRVSPAFWVFADRFRQELKTAPAGSQDPTPGCHRFESWGCFPLMSMIWNHAKSIRGLSDDQRDKINLPSLAASLDANRVHLEASLSTPSAAGGSGTMALLREFYGDKWFKCDKLSCFYFHEGFTTKPGRKTHLDRHARPFRCGEEDCPAAAIGFSSLKEMEKHRRNIHPGIDKLSASFARLKKGRAQEALEKYPCPVCPNKFKSRLECRIHMVDHSPSIYPKPLA